MATVSCVWAPAYVAMVIIGRAIGVINPDVLVDQWRCLTVLCFVHFRTWNRYEEVKDSAAGIPPGTHFYTSGSVKMHGTLEHRAVCTPNIDALLAAVDLEANS